MALSKTQFYSLVIPAKAGILDKTPAFAGVTIEGVELMRASLTSFRKK
jgi:hypothetical protein